MDIVSIIVVIAVGAIAFSIFARVMRRRRLMQKYGDASLVDKLMRRMFWTGQPEEQLIDSLGKPNEIDRKVLKTKIKEVWKYNQRTRTRFGLRITLEDGFVIGWDQKA